MRVEGDWADLVSRGFVVVRGFLNTEVCARIVKPYVDHFRDAKELDFSGYRWLGEDGTRAAAELEQHIRGVMPEMRERTGIDFSVFDPFGGYFPNKPCNGWHTDPPNYYMFQHLARYVNCWVPLIKPKVDESGLSIVPMDALKKADPATCEAVREGGCATFATTDWIEQGLRLPDGDEFTFAKIQHPGREHPLFVARDGRIDSIVPKVDIDQIAIAPNLSAGDAIFVRGDVLHRSQDDRADSSERGVRIAASMRIVDGDLKITKEFIRTLPELYRMDLANPNSQIGKGLLGAFHFYGHDTLSPRELTDYIRGVFAGVPDHVQNAKAIAPTLMQSLGVNRSVFIS